MNHEVSVSVALFLQDENVPLLISTAIAYDVSTPRVHAKSVTRQRVFVESPLFFFGGGVGILKQWFFPKDFSTTPEFHETHMAPCLLRFVIFFTPLTPYSDTTGCLGPRMFFPFPANVQKKTSFCG